MTNYEIALKAEMKLVTKMVRPTDGMPPASGSEAGFSELAAMRRYFTYYIHPAIKGRGFMSKRAAAEAALVTS